MNHSISKSIESPIRRVAKLLSCLCLIGVSVGAFAEIPSELKRGMIYYEIQSGNALKALSLMDEDFERDHPVLYASALQGFGIDEATIKILDRLADTEPKLSERQYFQLGKLEYQAGRCIPALKTFKKIKNKLHLGEKQEWGFYRASCFIELGSPARAAQILTSRLLSGLWISHAYYNLAMSYAEKNSNKTKAIVSLKVAESVNAGKTPQEKELNDQINIVAGQLYLKDGQPDKAIDVLNRVFLDSSVSALALYFRGVAYLEQGDFRAATQSWASVKKYHLIEQGVKESLLAIPFAYERGGYIGQALEAYTSARDDFTRELSTLNKIEDLIKQHGVRDVFLDEDKIEGLEWFLSSSVAANTVKAAYFKHLMRDDGIYELVKLYSELKVLSTSLSYWKEQLGVFQNALKKKQKSFVKRSKSFNVKKVESQIRELEERVAELLKNKTPQSRLSKEYFSLDTLNDRLQSVRGSIKGGDKPIKQQLSSAKSLKQSIGKSEKSLQAFKASLEEELSSLVLERMKALKQELIFSNERSEQGLTHILETVAEMNNKKRKQGRLKDGLYQ